MAHTHSVIANLGSANSGLTLTAGLLNPDGSANSNITTTNILELAVGTGIYGWTGTILDGFNGYLTLSSGSTLKFAIGINPQESENADIRSSSIAGLTATSVWTALTRTLTPPVAQSISALNGPNITVLRGDTITVPFTELGSLVGRSKLWFTVKASDGDLDAAAIIQIEETGGLLYLNGLTATSNQGSLVVTDQNGGAMTVSLIPIAAASLPLKVYHYDVQVLVGTAIHTLTSGSFTVDADITRATS